MAALTSAGIQGSAPEVISALANSCRQGVSLLSPPTDQVFWTSHVFFRAPDGTLLELFADI